MRIVSIVLFAVALCFLVSGCAMDTGEKIANLEKKVEVAEGRLDSFEGRIDAAERRLTAVEDYFRKQAAQKEAVSAAAQTSSMSIQDMQIALKNAGFYKGAVDGKMGPATDRAIKDFQAANGLKPDGVAGAKTKAMLMKHLTQAVAAE
jgi:murein L,D-transpeptidase YcbB/YkuD